MRSFLVLCGLLGALAPAPALGKLVQPDGSVVALAEESGGATLLFPPQAVDSMSWLTLPVGSTVAEVELLGLGYRSLVPFPTVAVPGVRFALEVPAHLLSLTIRGRLGSDLTLVRTLGRPGVPGKAWVTRSGESLVVDLPGWKTAPGYSTVLTLVRPSASPWKVWLGAGHISRAFSFPASVLRWDFAPQAWGFTPSRLEVTGADPRLTDLRVRAISPQADLPADAGTLLVWPSEAWRSPRREWFSWSGTAVLVLVTADYRIQDDYLKRLAFYVEKSGYRGRLVSDAELGPLHGWNAHDYAAPDLARFFTQAAQENFVLNAEEMELRDRLVAAGVLRVAGDGWEPGVGALVGISQGSPPALKAVLFTHEAFHGLYYTSPEFREGVAQTWSSLSEGAKSAFRSFLALSQYDSLDEPLMVNEFQAYVLQRPETDWAPFFRDRVLGRTTPGATALGWLNEYLTAARTIDSLVGRLYGLRSGRVSITTP